MPHIDRNRYYRRLLKGLLVVVAFVLIVVAGLHIWFVNNARTVLKQMVASESGGKLRLELSELRFEFATNKIQIREANLVSTDSLTQPATYQVRFRKLTLKVASFWPLLLRKQILLDSIKLHDPDVIVTQWRPDTATKLKQQQEVSIPQQMGRLYNSMLDALDGFGIRRIMVNNMKVTLVNRMKAGSTPVVISNLYFNLARSPEHKGRRDAYIANVQTVDLTTTDQDIAMPGGRHRLAFKSFRLELFRKRIELDSCTVTANASDSTKSSYRIFFRKLLLVGADFDAMYRANLIKADSVYCENPLFDITINTKRKGAADKKKDRPNPEQIVRELTGDLNLAFVGVKDAGIHINITGQKDRSLFNSNKDDFEMRGLRINGDSARPVVVQRFDMLVRDYHLYNEDSSAAYTFDSIHFVNNRIVLNRFTMRTQGTSRGIKKQISIPYFELTGLDWYALIFDQNLVAQEASLYNPVISFATEGAVRKKRNTSLFTSLHTLDDLVTLRKLTIYNGQVALRLGSQTSIDLSRVDLALNSDQLLRSRNRDGLRQAVERLSFSNGRIRLKDVTATVTGARYAGNQLLRADRVQIQSNDRRIVGTLTGFALDNLLLDDASESVVLDGVHWNSGQLNLHMKDKVAGRQKSGKLVVKKIDAGPTNLHLSSGALTVQTRVQHLRIALFEKNGTATPRIEGLDLAGTALDIRKDGLQVSASRYEASPGGRTVLSGLALSQVNGRDTIHAAMPQLTADIDINSILAKDRHIASVDMKRPVITMRNWNEAKASSPNPATVTIARLLIDQPDIRVELHRNDSATTIVMPVSVDGRIEMQGLAFGNGLRLDRFIATASGTTFQKTGGEVMGVEKGSAFVDLAHIELTRKDGVSAWSALINKLDLQHPNNMVLGKRKSRLSTERLTLGNLSLSSGSLGDADKLMKLNVSAWLQTATGSYVDSTTTLRWYNAAYESHKKLLTLDSFFYQPTSPLDSVMKNTPYQTDYITFHSGAVRLTDFNLERYKTDTAILGNTLSIDKPYITIYRDKAPPFQAGKWKPLPVNAIRNIPVPVWLREVILTNGELRYTEKNAKSGMEGTLVLARLRGTLSNIRNRGLTETDSLRFTLAASLMDSADLDLRVRESYTDSLGGFLMTLRMKPTGLSFLNPVLAPLSNVTIRSGTIDSLQVRVIGGEEVAVGAMNMYYHDLRIRLVKGGDENRSGIAARIGTFLANAIVIRKNNNGRTGFVYYERDKDRSFFNYLIRMTFSGMAASVGVKKNSKYEKKYRKLIAEKGLPHIGFE
ncbi:MAG: hypothetical protein JWP27_1776 [Flaviaesturariibacter sp.]|nr:hypothetical protein [Flaviaesturariibacter sp.]